jgi:hypothetical protein
MSSKIYQWLLRIPRFHWFFVFLTGVLVPYLTRNNPDKNQRGEWYPFSNFPMYSTFEDTAYYVYVTDVTDKPLALVPAFGRTGSEVKKLYNGFLNEEVNRLKQQARNRGEKYSKGKVQMTGEECRPAGDATLRQLLETAKSQGEARRHPGLRLHQVDITLEKGAIVRRTKTVGELRS